jgi:adenylate/nucleoside-diphosphate kinase
MRDNDNSAIDELKEAFEGKMIRVVEVQTEGQYSRLMQKINHELNPVFLNRSTLLEKNLALKLKSSKADELLQKGKAKVSCFGNLCPVSPEYPINKNFPVLFRDRIYYPGSEIDRAKLVEAPWMYLSQDTHPRDVDLNIFVSVLGGPASGKTTLAKDLEKDLGVVRVSLRNAVSQLINLDSELAKLVLDQLALGKAISDDIAVDVISWRLGLADVLQRGCVLDGFPKTADQAVALAAKDLLPNPVFYLECDKFSLLKRLKPKFKHDDLSLKLQMNQGNHSLLETVSWYENAYDNIRYISSNFSKWWVKDSATTCINSVFTSKRNYSISLIKGTPVRIKNLPISRSEISGRFGKFKRYDPIILKYKGDLQEVRKDEFLVEYRTKLYAFETFENMQIFMKNPEQILKGKNLPDYLPRRLALNEVGDIYESRIELESNCVVSLAEDGSLVKGNPTLLVTYNDKVFCFKTVEQREKFMKRPQKYEKTKLPVKIPPKPDNFVNFVLEEFETSVGFLDQMLGQVIIKALLEVGTQKLMYPKLCIKETALKHFALFLKANNPSNSKFQKEKYSKKLWEFKQKCWVQREIYEDGVRMEASELRMWEVENYFKKGEEYDQFVEDLRKNIDGFIEKYFR